MNCYDYIIISKLAFFLKAGHSYVYLCPNLEAGGSGEFTGSVA